VRGLRPLLGRAAAPRAATPPQLSWSPVRSPGTGRP